MKIEGIGKRLVKLREKQNMSQKEFAEFISVPQPTISAYENERITPTVEALINIADKCNVSLDWICGRSSAGKVATLSEIAAFLFDIAAINEIDCTFKINDHLPNDIEEPDESDPEKRWYSSITFFGNDREHAFNADMCNILEKVSKFSNQLDNGQLEGEYYDYERNKWAKYYSLPVTYKTYRELSSEEDMPGRGHLAEYYKQLKKD